MYNVDDEGVAPEHTEERDSLAVCALRPALCGIYSAEKNSEEENEYMRKQREIIRRGEIRRMEAQRHKVIEGI